MNKQIFALVAILATFNVAYSACDATTGTITMGVCQYHNVESLCKTWTSAKVCATCATDSTAVTSTGVCACGETGKANFGFDATPELKCLADATTPTSCPDGMMTLTGAIPCAAGTVWGCKTYATDQAAATCTACYTGATYAAATGCANDGKNVIRGIGYVDSCPDGYVAAAAGNNQDCLLCAPGCKTCTAAALDTCVTCADGYEVVSGKCQMICDDTCAANQCTGTKFNCTTCADGKWQTIAANAAATATVCTDMPTAKVPGCKTANADDDTLCDECETDLEPSTDKKICDCKDTTKGYAKFDYAAEVTGDNATPEVLAGYRCTACPADPGCTADQICRAKAAHAGVECKAKPAPPVEVPTCEDAALKKAGCKTCAKPDGSETFECSACLEGFAALDADKACPCVNDNKKVLWVDSTSVGRCKTCATECDAAKFCAIDSTGTESCADTAATNDAATTDSANILTAALAILAIILA